MGVTRNTIRAILEARATGNTARIVEGRHRISLSISCRADRHAELLAARPQSIATLSHVTLYRNFARCDLTHTRATLLKANYYSLLRSAADIFNILIWFVTRLAIETLRFAATACAVESSW
jgi:hypothetical protein